MKRAVVSIACGSFYQRMSVITHPSLKAYADRLGADFIVWNDFAGHTIPHYQKLELGKLLDRYERVLYVDTDIFIREDTPDIFGVVPDDQLGMLEEGQYFPDQARQSGVMDIMRSLGYDHVFYNGDYYNSGVIVISQRHRELFAQPVVERRHFAEQTYLNAVIAGLKIPMCHLPYRFNRLYPMDWIYGEERYDSYFMHYAGVNVLMPEDQQLRLMQHDLGVWRMARPDYKFPKHIAFVVQGDLAAQIAAEPTIRYARDVIYKSDQVIIVSDRPELFTHLNLPIYRQEKQVPDLQRFRRRFTESNGKSGCAELHISGPMNGVNRAALNSMSLELPLSFRAPRLPFDARALATLREKLAPRDLSRLVVLHAGSSSPEETFPADAWRAYAEALRQKGHAVVVVGNRGQADCPCVEFGSAGCVDLVDRLSTAELIALVSQAAVLVCSDSPLVAMAGAFDRWIGVIAPSRFPEHVLSLRCGSHAWRARCLARVERYREFVHPPRPVPSDAQLGAALLASLPRPDQVLDFVEMAIADLDEQAPRA